LTPFAPPVAKRLVGPPAQRVLDRLGVRQGFFNDYPLRLSDPNEVEPWLLATGSEWSSYWGYLFPRRARHYLDRFIRFSEPGLREGWKVAYDHALRRATLRCGGRPLVVKDPPNTGRIGALLDLWPEAVFVGVLRDPLRVLLSMRALWHRTILPRFSLQWIAEDTVASVVLAHYETVMEGWAAERGAIPTGAALELRYEDLVQEPLSVIEDVYVRLRLPGFGAARHAIQARLELDREYRPNRYPTEPALPEGWAPAIDRWRVRLGYPT
jgi:omega-hydroxy-beta-dihydromenaquinone-9 sulfotransferase